MNATKALKLLKPIPANEWIIDDYTDNIGKCCAIGHLVRLTNEDPTDYSRYKCYTNHGDKVYDFVRHEVKSFISTKHGLSADLASVNNDNDVNGYNQKKPKTRVIKI